MEKKHCYISRETIVVNKLFMKGKTKCVICKTNFFCYFLFHIRTDFFSQYLFQPICRTI